VLSEFLDELKAVAEGIVLNPNVKLEVGLRNASTRDQNRSGQTQNHTAKLNQQCAQITDAEEVRVAARHDPQTQRMVLTVSDTGIGISSSQLPFVFDKFWQVDPPETRTQSGIGMGLYIVKAFTERLGGNVTVSALSGKGPRFVSNFLPTLR
jgi:light-regulated signal transduction histidine kinase (bacteriophytochrome)